MKALLTLLMLALLAVTGHAQERRAEVQLDNGEVIHGIVVAMDQASLQIRVGEQLRTIPATRIKTCRFDTGTAPEGAGAPAPGTGGGAATEPAPPAAGDTTAPRISWTGPLPDPVDPTADDAPPTDNRRGARLRGRIAAFGAAYPWLAPAGPTQWVSLGVMMAILMCVFVHVGVKVAGAETPSFSRSMALAGWYLITGFLQIAAAPVNDLSVALMLLGNTTMALFWLCGLFALPRIAALIALAVQLGFVVLGYGTLELITAILGSVSTPGV